MARCGITECSIDKPLRLINFMRESPSLSTPLPLATEDKVDNPDYCSEEIRLQSFENWPLPYMDPAKMAEAGFYYTGEDDKVRHFECKVEIYQCVKGNNPMDDHQRSQEQCRFIRKIPCGNVPMGKISAVSRTSQPISFDACGPYEVMHQAGASSDCHIGSTSPNFQVTYTSRARSSKPYANVEIQPQMSAAAISTRPVGSQIVRSAEVCKVCFDKKLGIVFLPCSHVVTCTNCAPRMMTCPLCRQSVQSTIPVYFS